MSPSHLVRNTVFAALLLVPPFGQAAEIPPLPILPESGTSLVMPVDAAAVRVIGRVGRYTVVETDGGRDVSEVLRNPTRLETTIISP